VSPRRHAETDDLAEALVEMGRPARRAISVSECSLPSVKAMRIEVILLVTDRPDSVEFPATDLSSSSWSGHKVDDICSR